MTSAGKWVLGLLLLVVGAVVVARTVSSDPGSQAQVKLPSAETAGADKAKSDDEKAKAAADAAAKKVASTVAGDVACKKACIEVNEVANDAVTTAKLAPGSVTLSKLAFEVPNLNELENEINARKATEAALKAAQAESAAAGAKNDAAITAASANGITAEAAARAAADDALGKQVAAGDAALLGSLNKETADRAAADDVLQGKLNTEISDRAGEMKNLRGELINPVQVGSPILAVNNNEIVGNAVTTDKILDRTIIATDLAIGSVTTTEILNRTILTEDLSAAAVVGRAAGETAGTTNVKVRSLRGERTTNNAVGDTAGDLALGTITGENKAPNAGVAQGNVALETITGEGDNTIRLLGFAIGNLGIKTVGRNNLVDAAIDNTKLNANAVTTDKVANGTLKGEDVTTVDGDALTGANIKNNSLTTDDIGTAAVDNDELAGDAVTSDKIDNRTILSEDVAEDAITAFELADDSVDTLALQDGAVTNGKLRAASGSEAVDTNVIRNRAVTADKLGDDAVITRTIQDGAVTEAKIAAGNVTTGKLAGQDADDTEREEAGKTRAVTAGKVGDSAVITRTIKDGAVTEAKIAAGNVTTGRLAGQDADDAEREEAGKTRAVSAGKLGDDAVITRTIKNGAVTGDKIAGLTITAANLVGTDKANTSAGETRAITAEALADAAVTNRAIGTNSIDIDKLSTDIATEQELTDLKAALIDDAPTTPAKPALVDFNRIANVPADIKNRKASDLDCAPAATPCVQDGEIQSVSGGKVDGAVASATSAASATNATNATTAGTATTATGLTCAGACVSDGEISGLAFGKVTGVIIDSTMLADDSISGGTGGPIEDGTITAADLAGKDDDAVPANAVVGAVTSEKIADLTIEGRDIAPGAVDADKLDAVLAGRITLLETKVTDIQAKLADIADMSKAQGLVASTQVNGLNIGTASCVLPCTDPTPVAPGSSATIILNVPGIAPTDMVTVRPPALADGILVVGADPGAGFVTVRVYNTKPAVENAIASNWSVQWIDLTPAP